MHNEIRQNRNLVMAPSRNVKVVYPNAPTQTEDQHRHHETIVCEMCGIVLPYDDDCQEMFIIARLSSREVSEA
jgi:Fe2+ or Zn2+ uptake regulation protein